MTPITEEIAFASGDHTAAQRAWDPTHLDAQVERQVKIRACLDLATVLNTVPSAYRGVLSDLFARFTEKLEQIDQLTRQRGKLSGLIAKGEIPFNYNSLKPPHVQYLRGMKDLWNETFNLPASDKLTKFKQDIAKDELMFMVKCNARLLEATDEQVLVKEAWTALREVFERRKDAGEMYQVVVPTDGDGDWPVEALPLERSMVNPLMNELKALQVDLPTYFRKVRDLKVDLIERIHGKGKKKAEEKRAVDAGAMDVASSSTQEAQIAINKEVQRQVAAAMASINKHLAPSSSKKVRKLAVYHQDPTNSSSPVRQQSSQGETGKNPQGQEEGEEGGESLLHSSVSQGGSPGERQEAETPSWRRERSQQEWEARERKREAERTVEVLKRKPWTFGVPSSYPDEILTLSPSYQADVLLSRAPMSLLDSNRFRSPVHVQPGVDVPLAIQHDLSASLKFMFETKIDKTLIQSAYTDLVRRIRWKWFFMDKAGEDYDPDYDVVKSGDENDPPTAHPHIERGLQAGQDYVSSVMTLLPDADNAARVPTPLNLKRAREFVVSNNLIVTSTDKNLGVAVFKRDWIFSQATALFGDRDNYALLVPEHAAGYLEKLATTIRQLCLDHLEDSKQLSTFLCHNLPPVGNESDWTNWKRFVPEAYAIPKIHKNPWKGRPICPGFCLPQNAASKVLSKILRPFIDDTPWIIRGSKDFVRKLSNVRVPPGRKAFIVSADVVNFYPSVDTGILQDILGDFADNFLIPMDAQREENNLLSFQERRKNWYNRLFEIALAPPIMIFNDQIVAQRKGLPMGAAGSPDAANIFGYWYEAQWMDKVDDNPDILYYGRYLDDVYSVVLADTPDEALALLSFISLGDVKLLWEPPSDSGVFLDLSTRILENGTIFHEPFVKAMSHRERIPWSSAHPLDVKRGTFSSEISRLATLCSDKSVYLTQCEEAVNLYIGRGYPPKVVRSWLVKQQEKRWEDRVADKAEDVPGTQTFFTLKTHFNEAWKAFNVGEMQTKVTSQWAEYNSPSALGKRRGDDAGPSRARPPIRRVRVALQEHPTSWGAGQTLLGFTHEDGSGPAEVVGLDGVHAGMSSSLERLRVSNWTRKWTDTAKFLVSRKKNTQLWDLTRSWNKVVWNAYMERTGMRKPFDPLYEGPVLLNEEDE